MTRILTDGAETGDLTALTSGNPTINTTTPRSGSYSYYLTEGRSAQYTIPERTELYIRIGWKPLLTGNDYLIILRNGSNDIATVYVLSTTSRKVVATRGATVIQTSDLAITQSRWYLVEVYFKLDDSVGRIIVKIDGVTYIDFTGDTNPAAYTGVDNLYWVSEGFSQKDFRLDDIAVNDTNGAVDNSWCGDGKIVALVPTGDNSVQWLGSDGDATDNYALVDETPPSDSDYVRATGSAYTDIYNLTDYDFAGQTIQRIWMVSRAKSDQSGDYFYHGIQVSGSNYLVTGSLPTSFGRIDIQSTGTWNLNPYTGAAWSQEQLNALLLVIKAPG